MTDRLKLVLAVALAALMFPFVFFKATDIFGAGGGPAETRVGVVTSPSVSLTVDKKNRVTAEVAGEITKATMPASSVTFSAIPQNSATTVQQAIANASVNVAITGGTIANLSSLTLNTTATPYQGIVSNVTLSAPTGNEVAYTFDYTTNKATSGNDTGVLIRMTDTASPGTSYLIQGQKGGTDVFYSKDNGSTYTSGSFNTPGDVLATRFYSYSNNVPLILFGNWSSTSTGTAVNITSYGTKTNSSGQWNTLVTRSTYSQTGTSSNTDFLIDRVETAVGSGKQLFADFQKGSSTYFSVDTAGTTTSLGGLYTSGTVTANKTSLSGGSNGKAVCWKGTSFGYCSTIVGADGSCTCN